MTIKDFTIDIPNIAKLVVKSEITKAPPTNKSVKFSLQNVAVNLTVTRAAVRNGKQAAVQTLTS